MTELNLAFLGKRDYVYSASIYNALMAHLKDTPYSNFELSCHKFARCNMYLSQSKPKNLDDICFFAKCKKGDKSLEFYGTENKNSPITKREIYDEDSIFEKAEIDFENKSVILKSPSKYGIIEEIIALHKFLLQNLYKDQKGKWVFAKLQLDTFPLERAYPLKLQVEANFNFTLVKSKVFIGKLPPPRSIFVFCAIAKG